MRLSGTTLKVMGWLEPPPEGGHGLHYLWTGLLAVRHSQGRGFYREISLGSLRSLSLALMVEKTMNALDEAMDLTRNENSPEFKALFKDRERLLEELIELEEGAN